MVNNLGKEFKIVVVGLGYVGLPLALQFAKKFLTCGFDTSQEKIASYLLGVDPKWTGFTHASLQCQILERTRS